MHQVGESMHQVGESMHQVGESMHQVGESMHQVGESMHQVGESMHQVVNSNHDVLHTSTKRSYTGLLLNTAAFSRPSKHKTLSDKSPLSPSQARSHRNVQQRNLRQDCRYCIQTYPRARVYTSQTLQPTGSVLLLHPPPRPPPPLPPPQLARASRATAPLARCPAGEPPR
eukprot:890962-Prorocentrum_minimum.AAC.1